MAKPKQVELVYEPTEKSTYSAPGLRPGDTVEVDANTAKAYLATGDFKKPPKKASAKESD